MKWLLNTRNKLYNCFPSPLTNNQVQARWHVAPKIWLHVFRLLIIMRAMTYSFMYYTLCLSPNDRWSTRGFFPMYELWLHVLHPLQFVALWWIATDHSKQSLHQTICYSRCLSLVVGEQSLHQTKHIYTHTSHEHCLLRTICLL
jgi:hypothetical protein